MILTEHDLQCSHEYDVSYRCCKCGMTRNEAIMNSPNPFYIFAKALLSAIKVMGKIGVTISFDKP